MFLQKCLNYEKLFSFLYNLSNNQLKRPSFKVADVLSITKPMGFDCLMETLINLRQRTLPASNLMKAARIKTSHNLHCLNKNLVGGCCFICSAYAYRRKVEQNFWQQYYYYRLYSGYLYHACTVEFFYLISPKNYETNSNHKCMKFVSSS